MLKLVADDLTVGALLSDAVPSRASVIFLPHGVKPRVCVDLRPVNLCMRDSSVRYPAARDLASSRKAWFVKLDLKAAFKSVGLPSCVDRLMGFVVGGVSFVYTRLPFGWSWSPEVFSAALRIVLDPVRAQFPDAIIIAYVDDIAVGHDDPALCVRVATAVMTALRASSFRVSVDKTFLRPVRVLRFLGMLVRGGASPGVAVSPSIVLKCWLALRRVVDLGCSWAGVKLWGLISFAAQAAPRLALWRNALDEFASSLVGSSSVVSHPDARSPAFAPYVSLMHDACWGVGVAAAQGLNPIGRVWRSRVAHLVTDASASGFAARIWVDDSCLSFTGSFSVSECGLSSTARELLALRRSVFRFRRLLRLASVVWQSDSSAGVAATSNLSSSSAACRVAIFETLEFLDTVDADLSAVVWSPRSHPDLAAVDAMSRSPPSGGLPIRFPASDLVAAVRASPTPPSLHHDPLPSCCVAPFYSAAVPLASGPPSSNIVAAPLSPAAGVASLPEFDSLTGIAPGDVLIHCVSADFHMGKGLARAVREAYPLLPDVSSARVGDAVLQTNSDGTFVIHLVTKSSFFHKPTLLSLSRAVRAAARVIASSPSIRRIRLPRIGCGLDGLSWQSVRPLVLHELQSGCPLPTLVFELSASSSAPQRPAVPCPPAVWIGSHVAASWAGRAVFASPSLSEFPDVVDRFLSAARSSPSVLMMPVAAASAIPALSPLRRFCVSDVLLSRRGSPVSVLSSDGEWRSEPAVHEWRLVCFFASPSLLSSPRSLSRSELVSLLHASGFPPHPGPPKSLEDAWSAAARSESGDAWPALAMARALAAATPDSPPVVPTIRMLLEACEARSSAHASALMQATGWIGAYGPAAADVLLALEQIDGDRSASTCARAVRVASSMARLAGDIGMAESPYSSDLLDGLACAWVRARLRLPSSRAVLEHVRPHTPSAPSVGADCSALAARLRRLFSPCISHLSLPPLGLGPISTMLLSSLGASARHDASPKRVVWGWELRQGLIDNPEVALLHPAAVACLCLLGVSMWRSCYIRRLRVCDAMRLPDGNLAIRWPFAHKTNRDVGGDLPSTPKLGFIACVWVLEVVLSFILDAPSDTSPLFRDSLGNPLSYAYLTRVLRMLLFGLPGAASATLHGLRVGCDSELKALGVPDVIRDLMGWWRLALRRMSQHYEAQQLESFYRASRLYGSQCHQSLAPGVMASIGYFGSTEREVMFSEPVSLFASARPPAWMDPVRDPVVAAARAVMAAAVVDAAPPASALPPASSGPAAADDGAVGSSLRAPPPLPPPPASSLGPASSSSRAADAEAAIARRALALWRDSGGASAAAGVRCCTLCRHPGHNRRTCPDAASAFVAVNEVGEDESESDADDPAEAEAAVRLAQLPLPTPPSSSVGASLVSLLTRR